MTFRALLLVYRKPGTTPTQFRNHYEQIHVPLLKSIAGSLFPLQHVRTYVARSDDATEGYPAATVIGTPADFAYDAMAELVFSDQGHFERFTGVMMAEDAKTKIAADEEVFLDRERMRAVFLGETCVTVRAD